MKPALEYAVRTLLTPIIRLMLKNGVDVGEFSSIVKLVYVDVAADPYFALQSKQGLPKKITASRIALLTGINRKEVTRIQQDGSRRPDQSHTNRAVRVITGWTTDERFCDAEGCPRVLTYTGGDPKASFETLVRDYSGDMTPRVILDELIKAGAATTDTSGRVTLISPAYVPDNGNDDLLLVGSRAIRDLAETVATNIERQERENSLLQLSVQYSDVTEAGRQLFKGVLKKEATEFLTQQNRVLSSLDTKNNPEVEGEGKYHLGVGIYYIERESGADTPEYDDSPPDQ